MLRGRLRRAKIRFTLRIISRVIVTSDTGIVDEEMDPLRLLLGELISEPHHFFLLGDVAWEGMDAARAGAVCVDDGLEGGLAATGDVDFNTVDSEDLGYHEADSGAAACYDGGEVGDVEDFG